jgi:hypothetical protein
VPPVSPALHRKQRSLERALVASWKDECGKTYSHQCLFPRAAKARAGASVAEARDQIGNSDSIAADVTGA